MRGKVRRVLSQVFATKSVENVGSITKSAGALMPSVGRVFTVFVLNTRDLMALLKRSATSNAPAPSNVIPWGPLNRAAVPWPFTNPDVGPPAKVVTVTLATVIARIL